MSPYFWILQIGAGICAVLTADAVATCEFNNNFVSVNFDTSAEYFSVMASLTCQIALACDDVVAVDLRVNAFESHVYIHKVSFFSV